MKKDFCAKFEAVEILELHTEAFMTGADYIPENEHELRKTMVSECSSILVEKFLEGEYTLMEYNEVRNALAAIIWDHK